MQIFQRQGSATKRFVCRKVFNGHFSFRPIADLLLDFIVKNFENLSTFDQNIEL